MKLRPLHLRRSWLFVGATNENDIKHSYKSEADVCILEFEDFCAPKERPLGRKNLPKVLEDWKKKGKAISCLIPLICVPTRGRVRKRKRCVYFHPPLLVSCVLPSSSYQNSKGP